VTGPVGDPESKRRATPARLATCEKRKTHKAEAGLAYESVRQALFGLGSRPTDMWMCEVHIWFLVRVVSTISDGFVGRALACFELGCVRVLTQEEVASFNDSSTSRAGWRVVFD